MVAVDGGGAGKGEGDGAGAGAGRGAGDTADGDGADDPHAPMTAAAPAVTRFFPAKRSGRYHERIAYRIWISG
jgi:hypothetical protein